MNPRLPSISQRQLSQDMIRSSPYHSSSRFLQPGETSLDYERAWEKYCAYKRAVPCCGGILLNEEGDKVGSVSGYDEGAMRQGASDVVLRRWRS